MKEKLKEIRKKFSYEKREVTLASGRKSNFYFDGKQTTLNAEGAYLTGKLMFQAIKDYPEIKAIGGPTMGADPIATSVAVVSFLEGTPLNAFIVRKEPKKHGKMLWIEGSKNLQKGDCVAIVEDVITTGGSILKAAKIVEDAGYYVKLVVVLVDREEGGRENIEKAGYKFISILKKSEIVT